MEKDPIGDLFERVIAYQRQLAATPDAKTLMEYLEILRREWRHQIAVMTSITIRVERILDELDDKFPMARPADADLF